jgi:ADP-ribose pyrophosphatase YjhB (NUDIX family)
MTQKTVNAAGVWFYSQTTNRYLYLLRNDPKNPECWSLPGGKSEIKESLLETIERECGEELGSMPNYIKLMPIEKFTSDDGVFAYHTFFCVVENEFIPKLNHEHFGYAWVDTTIVPKPLHKGLWSTINFEAVQSKISIIQKQLQTSQ